MCNLPIIGIKEEGGKKEKKAEKVFETIMAKNLPKLMKLGNHRHRSSESTR
jgi:hypothetical protein